MTVERRVSGAVVRWAARILSAMILLFWGVMLIAHVFGDAGNSSRALSVSDYTIVGALVVSLGGLALAWRWEGIGAVTTLLAVAVCAAVNWKVLIFPGLLMPVAAILFLLSWLLDRARSGVPA